MKKVVIRADSSVSIGVGHIARCLNLAKELRERGAEVLFLCRRLEGNASDWLKNAGFQVCLFDVEGYSPGQCSDYEGELRVVAESWHREIEVLAGIFDIESKADWLIVDHYALDEKWENLAKRFAAKLAVIDDMANRPHCADLLLDQNYFADADSRYDGRLNPACRRLLGPQFALLASDYSDIRASVRTREGAVRRLLVFFGGSDANNLTLKALKAFVDLKMDISCDVVVGGSYPHLGVLKAFIAPLENVILHVGVPSLAPLLANADLAIGGAGVNSWERCCLGLPAIVISLAENQQLVAEQLAVAGAVIFLGDHAALSDIAIKEALARVISSGLPPAWSERCFNLVDGLGRKKVADIFVPQRMPFSLIIRKANEQDCNLLLHWANDPEVRKSSFSPEPIAKDAHTRWFFRKLARSESCQIYILETRNGLPVGQVRFDLADDEWLLDYSVDQLVRGCGWGVEAVKLAIGRLLEDVGGDRETVVADILMDNDASRRTLEKVGFHLKFQEERHARYSLDVVK